MRGEESTPKDCTPVKVQSGAGRQPGGRGKGGRREHCAWKSDLCRHKASTGGLIRAPRPPGQGTPAAASWSEPRRFLAPPGASSSCKDVTATRFSANSASSIKEQPPKDAHVKMRLNGRRLHEVTFKCVQCCEGPASSLAWCPDLFDPL